MVRYRAETSLEITENIFQNTVSRDSDTKQLKTQITELTDKV